MENINWKNIETIEDTVENPKGTILYLHAFSGSYKNKVVLRHHLNDFSFYALNMPGHGNSKFNNESEIDYYFYKELAVEYIKKNDLKDFILIGHSMGGGLSILISTIFKDRVKKLILETPTNPQALADIKIIPKLIPDTYEEMKDVGSQLFYDPIRFFGNEPNYQRFLKREYEDLSNRKYLKKLLQRNILEELSSSIGKEVNNIKIPTMIIFGKHDEIVPAVSGVNFFKKYIPHAQFEILENAKHVPVAEQGKIILPKIVEFINN